MAGLRPGSDHDLGRRIAGLIASQGGPAFEAARISGQVQDLLGEDTRLLGPLRDLLQRPGFRRLFAEGQHAARISGRDALLQDLATLYHPAVVARLAALLDGALGLPAEMAGSAPPAPGGFSPQAAASPPPSAFTQPFSAGSQPAAPSGAGAWASAHGTPPATGSSYGGAAPPPSYPPIPPPSAVPPPAPAASTTTQLLTVVATLLAACVALGLGWLLLQSRPLSPARQTTAAGGSPSVSRRSPMPPPPLPPAEATPKGTSEPSEPAVPPGAWGGASAYKFGQLPGGDYPNSCAFSETDATGRNTTAAKGNLEYWACRDVGGDPETGYRVVWADGKETTYTFAPDGGGMVVGTNGTTYPMRWSNDSHQGSDIVVINHQDGAISWIPGHIRGASE